LSVRILVRKVPVALKLTLPIDRLKVDARLALRDSAYAYVSEPVVGWFRFRSLTERYSGRHNAGAISARLSLNVLALILKLPDDPRKLLNTEIRMVASTIISIAASLVRMGVLAGDTGIVVIVEGRCRFTVAIGTSEELSSRVLFGLVDDRGRFRPPTDAMGICADMDPTLARGCRISS